MADKDTALESIPSFEANFESSLPSHQPLESSPTKETLDILRKAYEATRNETCFEPFAGWFQPFRNGNFTVMEGDGGYLQPSLSSSAHELIIKLQVGLPDKIFNWLIEQLSKTGSSLESQSILRRVLIMLSPLKFINSFTFRQSIHSQRSDYLIHWSEPRADEVKDIHSRLRHQGEVREQQNVIRNGARKVK